MNLRPENRRIEIAGEDAIEVLRVIEVILISLHKIGSCYAVPVNREMTETEKRNYEQETNRFIDGWKVTSRLSKARRLLSERFDLTLGKDDMDDVERALESVDFWSGPGSSPSRAEQDRLDALVHARSGRDKPHEGLHGRVIARESV